jgi:hypothetical protein
MLVVSVFSNLKAQEVTSILLFAPKAINQSSPFEIAFVGEVKVDSLSMMEVNLGFDQSVNFIEAKVISSTQRAKIAFVKNQSTDQKGNWFNATINFNDYELRKGSSFQILISLSTSAQELMTVNSYFTLIKRNNQRYYFPENSHNDNKSAKSYLTEKIDIHKQFKKGIKAASLTKNSSLITSSAIRQNGVLTLDCWLKFNDFKETFLTIYGTDQKHEMIALGLNENRFLTFYDNLRHLQFFKKGFVSRKVWNHFIFELNINEKTFNYYLNGEKIAQSRINYSFPGKTLSLEFGNDFGGSFLVENLRLSESYDVNSYSTISKSKNNDYSRLDSINVLAFSNFDNSVIDESDKVKFKSTNLTFVRSDAPIYSVVPEFNVNLTNTGCKLDWTASDNNSISYFQVEKSVNGIDFRPIAQVLTEQNSGEYSYYDSDNGASTLYYRIKQINIDGSFVYSSSSKVGRGNVQSFLVAPNYPNPFNPKTLIKISIYEDSQVNVIVYSLEGKEIQRLQEGELKKGEYQFEFDGSLLPSGIYLYTVTTPFFSQTKKMILAK